MGRNGSKGGWLALLPSSLGTCPLAIVLTFDLVSTCLGQCPLGNALADLSLACDCFPLVCLFLPQTIAPGRMGSTWEESPRPEEILVPSGGGSLP